MPANPGLVAVGSDYVVFPGKRMGMQLNVRCWLQEHVIVPT